MIRYALVLHEGKHGTWQDRCVRSLREVAGATPVAVIYIHRNGIERTLRPQIDKGGLLWRCLRRFDIYRNRPRGRTALALPDFIAALPQIDCALERHGRYAYCFSESDLGRIRNLDLDFIVAFLGYKIIRGAVLDLPKHGVWSYHHGDPSHYRGGPPGVWEIFDGTPRTGAVLQRLTHRLDGGIILQQGSFATIDHSFALNANNVILASAGWLGDAARALVEGGTTASFEHPIVTSAPIRRAPNNRQALRLAAIFMKNNIRRLFG